MLNALIVDDEAPARNRLRKLLEPFEQAGRIHVAGEAADGTEALAFLAEEGMDMLFLDVQMPGLGGFDLLERLDPERRPEVVFVTAHDHYAVDAFEAHAIDYLLKPVTRNRLTAAIERAESLRQKEADPVDRNRIDRLLDWFEARQEKERATDATGASKKLLKRLSIPYRDRTLVVQIDRMIAAEIVDGLTRVTIVDEEAESIRKTSQYVVGYTLEQLETRLDPQSFVRVHRSAIVALDHIREVQSWFSGRHKLKMTGGLEVIVSRTRSRALKDALSL